MSAKPTSIRILLSCTLIVCLSVFSRNDSTAQNYPNTLSSSSGISPDYFQDTVSVCDSTIFHFQYLYNPGNQPMTYQITVNPWFWDEFEEGLGKWNYNGSWGISSQAVSGAGALSDSPDGNYAGNTNQYIEMKEAMTVVNAGSCYVSYNLLTQTEGCCDEFKTLLQVNGGSWILLDTRAGTQEYTWESYYLASFVENGDLIKIRFEFIADALNQYDGISLDEFFLDGVASPLFWFDISSLSGTVAPGDSLMMTHTIHTAGLAAGDYYVSYIIECTDTTTYFFYGGNDLNISGMPVLSVPQLSYSFLSMPAWSSDTVFCMIYNEGCDTLRVDSIQSSSVHFFATAGAYNIPAYDSLALAVVFLPQSTGMFNGSMSLFTNAGSTVLSLIGEGLPGAGLVFSPQIVNVNLTACDDLVSVPVLISNPGQLSLVVSQVSLLGYVMPPLCQPASVNADEESGIFHVSFHQINHSSAGASEGYADHFDSLQTLVIPGSEYVMGVETAYWDIPIRAWIDYNNDGDFNMGNELVFNYIPPVGDYAPSDAPQESSALDTIRIPYSSVQGTWLRMRVGTAYPGSTPMPCDDTRGQFEDYAVMVNQPLAIDNAAFSILPGDSVSLLLSVNAAHMPEGMHPLAIHVSSNNAAGSNVYIPVNVVVSGEASPVFSHSLFAFGSTTEHNVVSDTLTIFNMSCGKLILTDVSTVTADFSALPMHTELNGYDSLKICVRFQPADPGSFADTLRLQTSDGLFVFPLTGTAFSAPHLAIDSTQIGVTLEGCYDSVTRVLAFFNPGSDTLSFTIHQNTDFFEDFEDETLSGWEHQVYGEDSLWHISSLNAYNSNHSLWCGVEFQENYATGNVVDNAILTPYVDLRNVSGEDDAFLSFWQNYNTQYELDLCKVQISADSGATWGWLNGFGYSSYSDGWEFREFDLSQFSGDVVRIRFYFRTLTSMNNNYPGWFIDDVRIGSKNSSQQWLSVWPKEGQIPPGSQQEVNLAFTHANIFAGSYHTRLGAYSNAPANPLLIVDCSLEAKGNASLMIHDTAIIVPEVLQNAGVQKSFYLYNTGCDTLVVSSIQSGFPQFWKYPAAFMLLAGDSLELDISFHPAELGSYSGSIEFFTNIGQQSIPVYGQTGPAPLLTLSPSAAISILAGSCHDSIQYPVILNNSGPVNLSWNATVAYIPAHRAVSFNGINGRAQLPIGQPGTQWTIEAWANPDSIWAGRKTVFGGVGPSSTACNYWALCMENGIWGMIIKPQSGSCSQFLSSGIPAVADEWVHLAGVYNGDSVWFYINGILKASSAAYTSYNGYGYVFIGGEYQNNPAYFDGLIDEVRQWNIPRTASEINATMHRSLKGDEPGLKGCWDMDETSGSYLIDKSPAHRNAQLLGGYARVNSNTPVNDFLSLSASSGNVGAGVTDTLMLTVYSTHINSGTSTAYLSLVSNDPLHSFYWIPCKVEVNGEPMIQTSVDCVVFDSIMQLTQQSKTMTVFNRGCDTLFLSGSYCESDNFSVVPSVLFVPPGESRELTVVFHPGLVGEFSDTLFLPNNDSLVRICLKGTGLPAPVLILQPESLLIEPGCDLSGSAGFSLSNEGLASLHYSVLSVNSSWLSFTGSSGSLGPGQSTGFTVQWKRKGLPPGTYSEVLYFVSDDPRDDTLELPLTLQVIFPDNSVNLGNDTTLCLGASLILNAGSNYSSYLWNTGETTQVKDASYNGFYAITVTDLNTCSYADTIMVITVTPAGISMIDDTVLCSGTAFQLMPDITGSMPQTPSVSVVGSGTNYFFYPSYNPFSTSTPDKRTLMIYRADELHSFGLSKGMITEMALKVGYNSQTPMKSFHIKVGFTTNPLLTGFIDGLELVYFNESYVTVYGWNNFVFDEAIYWDGVQHILVEICFDNALAGVASSVQAGLVQGGTWSHWCDNCLSGCQLNGGSLANYRPNIKFSSSGELNQYTWTGPQNYLHHQKQLILPVTSTTDEGMYYIHVVDQNNCSGNDSVYVEINQSPVIDAGDSDTILAGSGIQLNCQVNGGSPPYNYSWAPVTGLNDPSIINPMATPAISTNFSVSVFDANNCYASDTISIVVNNIYTITGYLRYKNSLQSTMDGSILRLDAQQGSFSDSAVVNENGAFEIDSLINGRYDLQINPSYSWGGVNATDALMVSKHITHYLNLYGLNLQVADVNNSGTITSADPLLIVKRTVGLLDSFPAGEWRISPSQILIDEANQSPFIQALCIGDVNGSYNPVAKESPKVEVAARGQTICPDDGIVTINIRVQGEVLLGAMTLGLTFSDAVESVLDVSSGPAGMLWHIRNSREILMGWQDSRGISLKGDDILVSVVVRLSSTYDPGNFSISVDANSEFAEPSATVIHDLQLTYPVPHPAFHPTDFRVSVFPNPFTDAFTITLNSPEGGPLEIAVYDVLGYRVKEQQAIMIGPGQSSYFISLDDLADGVYLCHVSLPGQQQSHLRILRLVKTR